MTILMLIWHQNLQYQMELLCNLLQKRLYVTQIEIVNYKMHNTEATYVIMQYKIYY